MEAEIEVVLLTNFVPEHFLETYRALDESVGRLTILLSTAVEDDRHFEPRWAGLPVAVQRTLTLRRSSRHPGGFEDPRFLHIPWDTIPRLWRARPDVVLSDELGIRTISCALYRLLVPRTGLVIWVGLSEQTEAGRGRVRPWVRRVLLRVADAVLVNGSSGARYLRSLGADDDKVMRLEYAAPSAVTRAAGRRPHRRDRDASRSLLYLGNLTERKGVVPFVRTLDRWAVDHPEQTVCLTVVGSGVAAEELDRLRLAPNLHLTRIDHVEYERVPDLLRGHGILAFPSLADEWGLVTNEAFAAGMPVLGSVWAQSVDELCEEGVTGWRFRPDDPADVYGAIDRAMTVGDAALAAMRDACRRRVETITPERSARQMVAAAEMAAAAGRRRARGRPGRRSPRAS